MTRKTKYYPGKQNISRENTILAGNTNNKENKELACPGGIADPGFPPPPGADPSQDPRKIKGFGLGRDRRSGLHHHPSPGADPGQNPRKNPPTTEGVFAVDDQLLWCSTGQLKCCYIVI